MRDEFSISVKRTLADRVANRCSNPTCGAVTSGPSSDPAKTVNVGVGAHITAASEGGPRYDSTLTPAQRTSTSNGIWLCQTCGKLVDSDDPRYTVGLLRRWKSDAEDRTAQALAAGLDAVDPPLDLVIPSLESDESLLSYANSSIESIGRTRELSELTGFLEDDRPFAWWLWTGPAGVGKSRLAVELCRRVAGGWNAGFLRDADQYRLDQLRTTTPMLVVVDYAAQRSAWLSDALSTLTQRKLGAKLRVLVLERDAAGTWWDTVQRLHRFEEASQVAASMYGLPRHLEGLSEADVRTLIAAVAARVGASITSTDVENIADHALRIDSSRRPLFVFVATLDWLSDTMSEDRNEALRHLVRRADAQLAKRINSTETAATAKRVRFLGTVLGGTSVETYASVVLEAEVEGKTGLLPGVFDAHGVPLDELLEGLRPDILGELSVLDHLATVGVDRLAANTLLDLAWQAAPAAYAAFVERAAEDHVNHDSLIQLLNVERSVASSAWSTLVVDVIPLLRRSDHPVIDWILRELRELQPTNNHGEIDERVVLADFRVATLVFFEDDYERANGLYSQVLARADPAWPVHTKILNNRGITWFQLDRSDLGVADYTAVIDSEVASDENRACSLNNRADYFDNHNDLDAAIADRTAVLELGETTYNRRYIALIRRARALWRSGDSDGGLHDIHTILQTSDIAIEQKMKARLSRAEWLISNASASAARIDLEAVLASRRNFDDVESRARVLLSESTVESSQTTSTG